MLFLSIAFFYTLWNKSVKKEQKLIEEKLKYQYQTLKSQVNPHFLFNSFNTLSELIFEDAAKADKYVQELSSIYRYILDNEDKTLNSIGDEIEFVQRYFKLQQVRSGNKIQLSINTEIKPNTQVIPITVQALVENAIKHNMATLNDPLHIKIYIENDYLVVENNLQRKNTLESTTKKGLKNIDEQYNLLLKRSISIIENETTFKVKIPIEKV